jgi:hypothetical protein
MKTIKQIADEIGVSKQAVQKRISREPLANRIQPYTTNRGQTKYIDVHGIKLIKSAFDGDTVYTATDSPTTKTDNIMYIDVHGKNPIYTASDGDIVYKPADNLIYALQRELDVKNRQIETMSAQISDLTAALVVAQQTAAAAQALHAGTMKHLTNGATDGDTVEEESPPSWWTRLMGRGKKVN